MVRYTVGVSAYIQLSCVFFVDRVIIHCRCVHSIILYTCVHSVHTTKVNYTKLTYLVSRTAIPFSVHSVTFSDSTLGILCSVFSWYIPALKIDTFYIFFSFLLGTNEIIVLVLLHFRLVLCCIDIKQLCRFDKIIIVECYRKTYIQRFF